MRDAFKISFQKLTSDPDRGVAQSAKDALKLISQ